MNDLTMHVFANQSSSRLLRLDVELLQAEGTSDDLVDVAPRISRERF